MKNKAIFLDRDGVLNVERGEYTYLPGQTEIVEGVGSALSELKEKGYLFIVVSNQSGIAKGIYGHEDVHTVNAIIEDYLREYGVELEAIYYCPHHPDKGKCLCRKPLGLLFEKALHRFNIDPAISIMIGDKQRDIDAAEKVGIKGLLIEANSSFGTLIKNSDL